MIAELDIPRLLFLFIGLMIPVLIGSWIEYRYEQREIKKDTERIKRFLQRARERDRFLD
jgi:hypothetical protein